MKRRWVTAGALGLACTVAATLGIPGTAFAYSPTGACGSGYTVRASMPIGGVPNATVYLLRNGGSACVVTFKQGSAIGNGVTIRASVWIPGRVEAFDEGPFKYYAGPMYETWPCVDWGGRYGSDKSYHYC